MLLTTHAGILVNSDHVAFIGLRRELPSPSEPDPEPGTEPTFRVLLAMADGNFLIAARTLSLPTARFVREDIAHHWETGKARWKAAESLKRHAEGAYFADAENEPPGGSSVADEEELLGKEAESG